MQKILIFLKIIVLIGFLYPRLLQGEVAAHDLSWIPGLPDFIGRESDAILNGDTREYDFFYVFYINLSLYSDSRPYTADRHGEDKDYTDVTKLVPPLSDILRNPLTVEIRQLSNVFPKVQEINGVIIAETYYCEQGTQNCVRTSILAAVSETYEMYGCILGGVKEMPSGSRHFKTQYNFWLSSDFEIELQVAQTNLENEIGYLGCDGISRIIDNRPTS
ncbi:MAG TPA: hypothetical protein PKC68_02240 [Alphaproteobacteria bacterium]|nr:hypothetical protein [Alphaproteobacteria bacterium]